MFKGHPLTFHSHRPLCDLLLSAKGFEEHSHPQHRGWSQGGGEQIRKERKTERGRIEEEGEEEMTMIRDVRYRKSQGVRKGKQSQGTETEGGV